MCVLLYIRILYTTSYLPKQGKHNNLMSNSDKDFITRIQVSQLVTDDPYADDFYFHIMAALRRNLPNFGMPPGAPGPGLGGPMQNNQSNGPQQQQRRNNQRPSRRDNAMNKMAQNVQRLVDSAKQRNKASQRASRQSVSWYGSGRR